MVLKNRLLQMKYVKSLKIMESLLIDQGGIYTTRSTAFSRSLGLQKTSWIKLGWSNLWGEHQGRSEAQMPSLLWACRCMSDKSNSMPLSTISSINYLETSDADDQRPNEVDKNKPIEVYTPLFKRLQKGDYLWRKSCDLLLVAYHQTYQNYRS